MPAVTEVPSRLLPLAGELLENSYARENLVEGGEKLRDAYGRARKRRVKPSSDRRLRRQIEAAVAALDEGTAALAGGRRKPRRTGRKAFVAILVAAAAGGAAYWYAQQDGSTLNSSEEPFATNAGGAS